MRIVWVTWFFLDYRIPVFKALSQLADVEFYLLYNGDVKFGNINQKVKAALGDYVIPMTGEVSISKKSKSGYANKGFRIPYQPGLIRKLLNLKPDVIVSDGFFQWTYAPLVLRAFKGIPHVMCYERTRHTERKAQLLRKIYRKISLRLIDSICCSGILCGEYVAEIGFRKDRIFYGHMVADTTYLKKAGDTRFDNYLDIKKKLGISGLIYLYVGRLDERKGIMQMLNAWSDFTLGLNDKPYLLLIGSGEQDEIVMSKIQKQELNTVKVLGRVDYDDIAKYYKIADIFIIPTLEDNWSLVVPEAMACGLPIITSYYNGCWPELVQEANGWVMDPLNHSNFVETLNKSFEAQSNFKTMGEASLEIISKYNPQSAAMSIYDACKIAIGSKQNAFEQAAFE